ncbi:MAG: cobI [Ilumatobacteraceae bacterium]|nr:cobI [Ilumatobacteraceae bacterium]
MTVPPQTVIPGTLYGVGVGPGDPELMTLKAARRIGAAPVVAYFAARNRPSNARRIAAELITPDHRELLFEYPVTTEHLGPEQSYEELLLRCYDESAERVEAELRAGHDVAVLCEGDPLFYGSYMYIHNRLADRFTTRVVPGISSLTAGAAAIARPLACGDELLSVLSGVMTVEDLKQALVACDAAVIIKLGRNLTKVRSVIETVGLIDRAWYVERASHEVEVCCPLAEADAAKAPYFSMIVIPSAVAGLR